MGGRMKAVGVKGAATLAIAGAAFATNARLGNTRESVNPLAVGAVFYVDFWFQTDSASVGVAASDLFITYSGDLEVVDDPVTVLSSEATAAHDVYLYDEFGIFAEVENNVAAQRLDLRGGVDLLGGSRGEGQSGVKAKFARVAFRNPQGGGFTIRVEGNIGLYGEIVEFHDWLGVIGEGPSGSVTFSVAGGGEGLP